MRIFREGDHLVAERSGGQESKSLYPQSIPGKFTVRGANFVFRFLTDASGRIAELEITGPDDKKVRLPRLVDTNGAVASLQSLALAKDTSVKAGVYNGYERVKGPDGKFGPETIAFHEGGLYDENLTRDPSIESITCEEIAKSIAPALAGQGYIAATDVEKTDLLLMVYWGTTATDKNSAFRDQINRKNARFLGFEDPLRETEWAVGLVPSHMKDLIEDLERGRYWVAIVAFDFPTVRDEKAFKLLWLIRYNMPSRSTNFPEALPQMTKIASNFFGTDSKGLVVNAAGDVETKVEYGELEVIEAEEPPPAANEQ
jgi:hypothetical protein